jgi:hypothetical protein
VVAQRGRLGQRFGRTTWLGLRRWWLCRMASGDGVARHENRHTCTASWAPTCGYIRLNDGRPMEASALPCSSSLPSSTPSNEPSRCRFQVQSWKTVPRRLALAPAADRFRTSSGAVSSPFSRAPGLLSTQTSPRSSKTQIGVGTHDHCDERASCCMPSSVPNLSLFGLGVRE